MPPETYPRVPEIGHLTIGEIFASLKAGLQDFRAAPMFGVFFSSVYVISGFLLIQLGAGTFTWTLTLSLGFPLVAPFAAVGLYEVSRRLEAGLPLSWGEILAVVWHSRGGQIPWLGAIILIYFMFWTFLAHMIFALFMGPYALIDPTWSFDMFLTQRGAALGMAELLIGGVSAFFLFSMTAVSLPLLLEHEIDFVTAMLVSMRATRQNFVVMALWAFVIAALTVLALLPAFLGLLVVMPVLGHATWHIYRRVLYLPE
ncbi:MAG: DUF2189 domain-containing protein [Paracoccaceae bacterium]|nr:DUF2189 domain-containing protein [Paracoccaceae bacterium]